MCDEYGNSVMEGPNRIFIIGTGGLIVGKTDRLFYRRNRSRPGDRFCGNERRGGDQSDADHFFENGTLYGCGDCIGQRRIGQCGFCIYLWENKNLDIKNGLVMMISVLCFTLVGSYVSSLVPSTTMGGFSTVMTLILGIKFIVRPVMTTKEARKNVSRKKQVIQSIVSGIIVGFICGFVGAGGGMMMLLILTSVLGYELKTAVGTSVFIMAFTAFTGSASHFAIGGTPDMFCLICCILSTLLWARIAAKFANKSSPIVLNRVTGVVLAVLGAAILVVNH